MFEERLAKPASAQQKAAEIQGNIKLSREAKDQQLAMAAE
jgi:hypothetical protein